MAASPQVTPLALAVLKLVQERPMHPYEMQQQARMRYWDRLFKLRTGSLYHAVERLVRRGLLAPVETSRSGRRPERTVYAITDDGLAVYAEQVADMLAIPAQEYPAYRLAIGLATSLDRDVVLAELRRRRDELDRLIAGDQVTLERKVRDGSPRRRSLSLHYRYVMRQAERDWTAQVVDDLESGRLEWPEEYEVSPEDLVPEHDADT